MLDKNVLAIAKDFKTFQDAVNRVNETILELQEANKDVLIGKRNLNCLSCGKKEPGQQAVVEGTDGRIYKAFGGSKSGFKENTLDFTSDVAVSTHDGGQRTRVASANTAGRAIRFN